MKTRFLTLKDFLPPPDAMVNKRKRDDLSDSDIDEVTPGKQTLPVANLPDDFDQEPRDGMQYLFLVRRDARRLPRVTRVRNPYEVPETKVISTLPPIPADVLPCEEWRVVFQTHFSNLRKNLSQATIHVDYHLSSSSRRVIPEKKDRDAWWKFLVGYPESIWGPRNRLARKKLNTSCRAQGSTDPAEVSHPRDAMTPFDVHSRNESSHLMIACLPSGAPNSPEMVQTADSAAGPSTSSEEVGEEHITKLSPPEVTPSYLREIDHRMSIHLLMYFAHWINVHLQNPSDPATAILASHGRWIFALLTKVENQLSADEMNLLRNLARACLGLVRCREGECAKSNAEADGTCPPHTGYNMSDASCWMIFAAIAGQWGQRDLWADAEAALARV